jgi:integrase
MKLTATSIKTLALPPGTNDKTFFDDELPSFGLRLRAGGSARWVVQYDIGAKTRRMTFGSVNEIDLSAARKSAKDILAKVRLGQDPAGAKLEARLRAGETFGALLERYLAYKAQGLRPRSFKETERHLVKYARILHGHPVATIDRRAIAALVSTTTAKAGPAAANCMLGSLSGYFTWLLREGLIDGSNPAGYVNKAQQNKARDRVFTEAEFREIWNALGSGDYSDIVRLLALTAARKTEIGSLRWDEVDLEAAEIHLPPARTKSGRNHNIPLAPAALAILQARRADGREFVFGRRHARGFSGWAWSKRGLDERIAAARKAVGITAPMPSWVLHDLRRFFSTVAHDRLGIVPWICEAALGHVSGFKSGVSAVYNKAEYVDERRRALERWAEHLTAIVSGKPAKARIVRLRSRT